MDQIIVLAIVLLVLSFVAIIGGVIQLIITKGKEGLKYIIGGIITIVVLILIGFGTCVMALNS